jgi:hypothetical protein
MVLSQARRLVVFLRYLPSSILHLRRPNPWRAWRLGGCYLRSSGIAANKAYMSIDVTKKRTLALTRKTTTPMTSRR